MAKVLVAGATGALGGRVKEELARRGHAVRALTRGGAAAARSRGVAGEDVFAGDATRPETLRGACEGVGVVVSALGAPLTVGLTKKGVQSYREVDYAGNKNLLAEAVGAGVRKFVYVSVFGAEQYGHLEYVAAHEDFVGELRRSGIDYAVVRPTGFFGVFAEVLRMAAGPAGRLPLLGTGEARTNPVDERDVARVCADAADGDSRRDIDVGGPVVYTRREINELAFAALGRRPKMLRVPAGLVTQMIRPLRLFDRRLHALMSFLVTVSQADAVAPAVGTRSLKDYFERLANERRAS